MCSPVPWMSVSQQFCTEEERRCCPRSIARVKSSFYTQVASFYVDICGMHMWWLFRRSCPKRTVVLSGGFHLKHLISCCLLCSHALHSLLIRYGNKGKWLINMNLQHPKCSWKEWPKDISNGHEYLYPKDETYPSTSTFITLYLC